MRQTFFQKPNNETSGYSISAEKAETFNSIPVSGMSMSLPLWVEPTFGPLLASWMQHFRSSRRMEICLVN